MNQGVGIYASRLIDSASFSTPIIKMGVFSNIATAMQSRYFAATAGAVLIAAGTAGQCKRAKNKWQEIRKACLRYPQWRDVPDVSQHENYLAEHLTPKMYQDLRDKVKRFIRCNMEVSHF